MVIPIKIFAAFLISAFASSILAQKTILLKGEMVPFFRTQNSINFAQRWKKRH